MKQTLIILRGGPATGKSTICEAVQKENKRIIWLHVDSFKRFLRSGNDEVDRNHWYGAAAASLEYFLANKFSVLAEGIFQFTKHVEYFIEIANKYSVKIKVFELTAPTSILVTRDSQRKGVPEKLRPSLSKGTIKNLSQQVTENHFPNAEIIETNNTSIQQIVHKILSEFS